MQGQVVKAILPPPAAFEFRSSFCSSPRGRLRKGEKMRHLRKGMVKNKFQEILREMILALAMGCFIISASDFHEDVLSFDLLGSGSKNL